MLSLQAPSTPDELLLITTFQWFELWLKVLVTDTAGVIVDGGRTYESIKLLRRGVELFKLFHLLFEFGEHTLIRQMHLTKALRFAPALGFSDQQKHQLRIVRHLRRLSGKNPELDDAIQEYANRFLEFRSRFARLTKSTLLPRRKGAPSYSDWICLKELAALQQGVKASWTERGSAPTAFEPSEPMTADENMFVIVHQCFELWFKVILDHIDRAIPMMKAGEIDHALRLLRRVVSIQRLLVQQIQIPATMQPLDFARFRHESREQDGRIWERGLSPASGTESYLFREIEITGGLRDDPVFRDYLSGSEKLPIRLLTNRQKQRQEEDTLADAFHEALRQRGIARLEEIFKPSNNPNPHTDLAELADVLLEFDDAFRSWRLVHVSMVERMIGGKSGTGFLGPEYLMETAGIRIQEKNRIFPDKQVRPRFFEELWQVRTRLGSN